MKVVRIIRFILNLMRLIQGIKTTILIKLMKGVILINQINKIIMQIKLIRVIKWKIK